MAAIRPISINVSDLCQDANKSSLKVTAASGAGTISIYSISGFAINNILLIGEFGEEGSEIIKTHASTSPTGYVVTLASNLAKPHPKDTPVYVIPYDSIEISHADTITGVKSVLSTPVINPDNVDNRYDDTSSTAGYYFSRYKETIGNTFSTYSDAIPFGGYEPNTVGFIINSILEEMGKEISDDLKYQTLINKINECLSFVRGQLKRWSNCQEFDYLFEDQTILGNNVIALPTTYYDKNSNKSCQSLKVDGVALTYIDKKEYDALIVSEYSGKPYYFTIFDGSLYIPGVDENNIDLDITIDFYTDIVRVDSDSDVITGARYDMVSYWLRWEIRNITERKGIKDMKDGDYMLFMNILASAVRRESSGQKFKRFPKLNGITYGNEDNDDFDRS